MRQYQVTRKLQITLPKPIARELKIKPGDAVVFERAGKAVLVKKASPRTDDTQRMADAVRAFAQDMRKVERYVKLAERSLNENLSRHVSA